MNKMRTPLIGLLALVMMLMAAQVTSAAVFGHYPNASCPDTLSIQTLKNRLDTVGPCNPQDGITYALASGAPADTVLGVGGIITAFDEIPTGFDMFIQTTGGGPNTGIDVFTHGTNFRQPYGFQLGDSVIVEWAGVADFQGDKELASPNNNFSNPDIVLRKVNSGNTLPPFFTGTTTDFKELPTNATFAPYVSALVHLDGPVTVARTSLTGGLSFNSMLVVSNAAPSDSVFIDFAKMTNIVPPAVGTIINSIQGVGNKATRGFRIMPRNGDDIQDNVPPSISDAYAIADDKYRVVFDRSVTAGTATNTGNYTLGSFGNVDAAVMDGTFASVLTVSGTGLSHGQSESVQVNGITGVSNGQTMSVPQQRSFLAGVLSCGEMAQPNPDTLATGSGGVPCVDKPLYSGPGGEFLNGNFGPRSTVTGIVVGVFGNLYYMEDGTQDPAVNQINSRGITVFAPPQNLLLGHRYVIAGACQDFWQEAEFAAIQFIQDLGVAGVPAASLSLTPDIMALGDPCDATQTQLTPRDYLSTLVRMTGLKVVAKQLTPGTPGARLLTGNNGFWVAGPSPSYADTFIVENLNTVLGTNSSGNVNYPALNTPVNVTGVVHFTNNPASPNTAANTKSFRIVPRSAADLSPNVGVGDEGPTTLSFSAYPNPGRMVNLAFTLQRSTHIDLAVYDLLGRKVVTLAKGTYPAGHYQKSWNRTDGAGKKVGSGVYFYRLRAGDEVRTARTLLLSD
jgi:hypothetical protein